MHRPYGIHDNTFGIVRPFIKGMHAYARSLGHDSDMVHVRVSSAAVLAQRLVFIDAAPDGEDVERYKDFVLNTFVGKSAKNRSHSHLASDVVPQRLETYYMLSMGETGRGHHALGIGFVG